MTEQTKLWSKSRRLCAVLTACGGYWQFPCYTHPPHGQYNKPQEIREAFMKSVIPVTATDAVTDFLELMDSKVVIKGERK